MAMAWNYTKTGLILIAAQAVLRCGIDLVQGRDLWRSNGGPMSLTILLIVTVVPTLMLVDLISRVRERRRTHRAAAAGLVPSSSGT
ncbi:MAG: hypothetical protein ACT7A5_24055, partial [Ferrovibrionaceae bacterium]